jgi:hypothetical protein
VEARAARGGFAKSMGFWRMLWWSVLVDLVREVTRAGRERFGTLDDPHLEVSEHSHTEPTEAVA